MKHFKLQAVNTVHFAFKCSSSKVIIDTVSTEGLTYRLKFDDRIIMCRELNSRTVVAYFKILLRISPVMPEENLTRGSRWCQ
jgi:hypothetical protein